MLGLFLNFVFGVIIVLQGILLRMGFLKNI